MTRRKATYLGAGVTAIGALVLLISAVGAWRSSAPFPAWWEATSTFAAFLAAGVAVYFVMRQERRIADALVREQASKVAAWYGNPVPSATDAATTGSVRARVAAGVGLTLSVVVIRNASDLPVSSVWVALVDRGQVVRDPVRVGLLPPASEPMFEPVPPAAAAYVRSRRQVDVPDWEPDVAIAFVDASGNGWVRGPEGALSPVDRSVWDGPDLVRLFGPLSGWGV